MTSCQPGSNAVPLPRHVAIRGGPSIEQVEGRSGGRLIGGWLESRPGAVEPMRKTSARASGTRRSSSCLFWLSSLTCRAVPHASKLTQECPVNAEMLALS